MEVRPHKEDRSRAQACLSDDFSVARDGRRSSFTDKEICHLDDRITVIQLEPEDASLSGKQKIMLTKVYGLIDMTERNTSEGYSKTKKTAMVDMWA